MDNMSKILESAASLDLDAAAAAINNNQGNGGFSVICACLSFEVTLELCEDDEEFDEIFFRD